MRSGQISLRGSLLIVIYPKPSCIISMTEYTAGSVHFISIIIHQTVAFLLHVVISRMKLPSYTCHPNYVSVGSLTAAMCNLSDEIVFRTAILATDPLINAPCTDRYSSTFVLNLNPPPIALLVMFKCRSNFES